MIVDKASGDRLVEAAVAADAAAERAGGADEPPPSAERSTPRPEIIILPKAGQRFIAIDARWAAHRDVETVSGWVMEQLKRA